MAWIYRGSKGKWFYLESRIAGHRSHRALKTRDRAVAERELAKGAGGRGKAATPRRKAPLAEKRMG